METPTFWWKKFDFFIIFSTQKDETFFACLWKIQWRVYQNCITFVRKNKLKQAFLWKTFIFFTSFGLLLEIFRPNQFFFLAQLVKTAFYVAIRTFWETILSCKIVFSIIFRIQWKLFRILMKFPLWGCQNWNIRVQANNLRKILLFEKDAFFVNLGLWKKTFAHFSSFSRRGCRNCILCVQKNT